MDLTFVAKDAQEIVERKILPFMNVKKFEYREASLSQAEVDLLFPPHAVSEQENITVGKQSTHSKRCLYNEEAEAYILKESFLAKFPCYTLRPQEGYDAREWYYNLLYFRWKRVLPCNIRETDEPVTATLLENEQTNIQTVCREFLKSMDIVEKSSASTMADECSTVLVEEATLFLLERSLRPKLIREHYFKEMKERILKRNRSIKWHNNFPCPVVCDADAEKDLQELHKNEDEYWSSQSSTATDYFRSYQCGECTLFFTGESGSGKTHLALRTYTTYREVQRHHAACEDLHSSDDYLTIYLKITDADRIKCENWADGLNAETSKDNWKVSKLRNTAITRHICERMCAAIGMNHKGTIESFMPKAHPCETFMHTPFVTTFVVLDDVTRMPDLLRAAQGQGDESDLLSAMRESNLRSFFGVVYLICCSTRVKDFLSNYRPRTVRMGPSSTLLNSLASSDFSSLFQYPFFYLVRNRRCAVLAERAVSHQGVAYTIRKLQQDSSQQAKETLLRIAESAVIEVAAAYRESCALRLMTPEAAVATIHEFVRVLLTAHITPLPEDGELFGHLGTDRDAVFHHVVDVYEVGASFRHPTEEKNYSLSSAQILLAACSYGTDAPMSNIMQAREYFCGTMLLFFLNAFVGHKVQLGTFLRMLDPKWKGIRRAATTVEHGTLESLVFDFTKRGHVIFPNDAASMPYARNQEPLRQTLFESIKSHLNQGDSPTCVVCPPCSTFAGCFIIAGPCLLMLHCNEITCAPETKAVAVTKVLAQMGFSSDRLNTGKVCDAASAFATALQEAFDLECVVPIFCRLKEMPNACQNTEACGYGCKVYPMIFTPSPGIRVKLRKEGDADVWQWAKSQLVPPKIQESL